MKRSLCLALLLGILFARWVNADQPAAGAQQYLLRYRFEPSETLRWNVVHRAKVSTTVSGTSQTAETTSTSVKVWRLVDVNPDADRYTFEHLVESVDMRQKLTGREEVRYNSQTDEQAPLGFEDAARAVGVVLSKITINGQGQTVAREEMRQQPPETSGHVTIPLPAEPVALGDSWNHPHDIELTLRNGQVKSVKTRQRFALEDVAHGVATISVETQVLTPIHDPAVEAQLIQRETAGTVRFDIERGRVLSQQMDLDKRVLGFSGEASSMHYLTRFTEELLPNASNTARR